MSTLRTSDLLRAASLCFLLMLTGHSLAVAETNVQSATVSSAVSAESSAASDTLRAYIQLQEQLHATQLMIERTRRDAEEATAKNADALATQLRSVEQSLSAQRTREAHFMIYVLSVFAGISFLAVVITAYFQWRTVNRLADFTAALPAARPMGLEGMGAPGLNESSLVTAGPVEQSNGRLLGAIDRLEKRILELEHSATPALNGDVEESVIESHPETSNGHGVKSLEILPDATRSPENTTNVKQLLNKGQSLLNADQAEAALECFDQALAKDSDNAEALVKKGAALEKLRKLTEAVECYDRAIALDASMTIAYLHKGGLYNRMERFGEAVECYEKALQTQEKKSAA